MQTSIQSLKALVGQSLADPHVQFNSTLYSSFYPKFLFSKDFQTILSTLLKGKTLTFLRHAQSHINVFMQSPQNFVSAYPKNPQLYDPGITVKGVQQCSHFKKHSYEIIYCSPLRRTLQTYENIDVESKKLVVTPLITERNKFRAAVIGTEVDFLQRDFPDIDFTMVNRRHWWRHDYKDHYEKGLRRESDQSYEARIGFFILMALFEGSSNILIISHSVFLDMLHGLAYYERPENCCPYEIKHESIHSLFNRISSRVNSKL